MRINHKTVRWLIAFSVIFIAGLVITGSHLRIYRSAKLNLVKVGVLDAKPIDHVNLIPKAFKPEDLERLNLTEESAKNLRLLDEKGQVRNLSEFRSDIIFMNKWATWCAPCVAELPGIQRLYENTSKQVQFLMVTWDTDFDKAKNYKNKHGYTFPIYQVYGFEPEAFKTPSIPTTYVLPKNQGEMYRYQGMLNYDTPEFKDFLKQLNTP